MTSPLPLIGVPADVREIEGKPFHAAGDKYVRAVQVACDALPCVLPAMGPLYDLPAVVHKLDGLMLTGSISNVHPEHYGEDHSSEHEPYDRERDETTLVLIREALAQAVPLFAICRGFQEMNVALGGSLHPAVHELPNRLDHRMPVHDDPDVRYGPVHKVSLTPGGELSRLFGTEEIEVNSLHRQAVDRLSEDLTAEAVAPDGTIEGIAVRGAANFALGVQWHPEYRVMDNAVSRTLFAAFGDASRARARARAEGRLAPPQPVARISA